MLHYVYIKYISQTEKSGGIKMLYSQQLHFWPLTIGQILLIFTFIHLFFTSELSWLTIFLAHCKKTPPKNELMWKHVPECPLLLHLNTLDHIKRPDLHTVQTDLQSAPLSCKEDLTYIIVVWFMCDGQQRGPVPGAPRCPPGSGSLCLPR